MLILSGDIGGTHTRLQLTEFDAQSNRHLLHKQIYSCHKYRHLEDIIETFLKDNQCDANQIERACFAVAAPIVDQSAQFTNLPWFIDAERFKEQFGFNKVALINDFEANGYGIETLTDSDIYVLQAGKPQKNGPKSVIGAGTGLGVALMHWSVDHYHVIPTEGGHVDFAPTTTEQIKLLNYLHKKFHRVSNERIASGMGILNIYKFVRDNPLFGEQESEALKFEVSSAKDPTAAIVTHAHEKGDPMALRTVDIFIRAYATAASSLALMTLPYGGLYLMGGIAPKMLSQMQDGRFMEVFIDKGRMSHLLEKIPVYIVLDTDVGLNGAATYASRM